MQSVLHGQKKVHMEKFKGILLGMAITTVSVLIAFKIKEMMDSAKVVPPKKSES